MSEPRPAHRLQRSSHEGHSSTGNDAPASLSIQVVIAAVFALATLWLILRVTLTTALFEVRPDLAAAINPKHPRAAIASLPELAESDPRSDDALGNLLAGAPLAGDPLLHAARIALVEQNFGLADILLDEAVRRAPRSRQAHLLRLERQIRQNRAEDAAMTIAILSRLLPNSETLLIDELARLSADPSIRPAILRAVGSDERMRTQLLEALARRAADPETIFSFAGPLDDGPVGEVPRWQTLMLTELVSRGDVARARDVWRRLSGVEQNPGLVYDPEFNGLPGPAPFNWHFDASPDGFAELSRSQQGSYVEYYGRRNAVLGGQLLTLPAGSYRLTFRAEGSADGQGSRLGWTLACQRGSAELVTVAIIDVGPSPKELSGAFSVPADCPAQWLRLTGKFGEFPKDQRATIRELQIVRVGQP
jgi:hypothetical protein